jgi:hypothetical protein
VRKDSIFLIEVERGFVRISSIKKACFIELKQAFKNYILRELVDNFKQLI